MSVIFVQVTPLEMTEILNRIGSTPWRFYTPGIFWNLHGPFIRSLSKYYPPQGWFRCVNYPLCYCIPGARYISFGKLSFHWSIKASPPPSRNHLIISNMDFENLSPEVIGFKLLFARFLPQFFDDFDDTGTDYAICDLVNNRVQLGVIESGAVVIDKEADLMEGVVGQKVMGMELDKEMVLSMLTGVMIRRLPTETQVSIKTSVEEYGNLVLTYQNSEVWKLKLKP